MRGRVGDASRDGPREVKPNVAVSFDVPPNVQQARPPTPPLPTPRVEAEKIAEGVWYLNASNYHSIATWSLNSTAMLK